MGKFILRWIHSKDPKSHPWLSAAEGQIHRQGGPRYHGVHVHVPLSAASTSRAMDHLTGFTKKSPVIFDLRSWRPVTSVGSKKSTGIFLPRIGKINSNLTNLPVIKHENGNPSFIGKVPIKRSAKILQPSSSCLERFPVGHRWQPVPSHLHINLDKHR